MPTINHTYNPEFWTAGYRERHRVTPAFGALVMADYYDFLGLDPISAHGIGSYYDRNHRLQEQLRETQFFGETKTQLSPDLQLLLGGLCAAKEELYREATELTQGGHYPSFTTEQKKWMTDNNVFFWLEREFFPETRQTAASTLLYFAIADIAYRYSSGGETDYESVESSLTSDDFVTGLREAADARQSDWKIPDSHTEIPTFTYRVRERSDMSEPIIGEGGALRTDIATEIMYKRQHHKRNMSRTWAHRSSSGCPVRHTKLGPNVQAAFTEEQRGWITATVAEIDEQGVLTYTWDPFRATVEYIIPLVREMYEERRGA